MIGNREMSLEDYTKILRRRLRWVLLPAVLGALVGYLVTLVIPPEYTSVSLLLIERPTVPKDLVESTATDDLFTRLATMQEQIESRTRLQPLIERYDLYKGERKKSMEDAVEEMRKAISIQEVEWSSALAKTTNKQPVPGFTISFTSDNARQAQQVNTELTSMFMGENLQQHEDAARGTADFLANQLTDAKRALDEQDAKLAEFKRKNLGALPEDQGSNLQVLGTLNTQLASVTEELNRSEQDKAYAQSLLSQQEAAWKASQSGPDNVSTETLQDQLNKMKASLAMLQGRYTEDYPDVVKLKSNIVQVEKQIADQNAQQASAQSPSGQNSAAQKPVAPDATAQNLGGPASGAGAPASGQASDAPPSIQQLRARLKQTEIFIKAKTQEQAKLQQQIRSYESRLQVTPAVEEEYKQLSMGHDQALKFYNALLASRDQSQMSVDLETEGKGEHFNVLDSANLPQQPSFPVWWQFALGGLAGGLVIGMGLAVILELKDKAIRDERDVEFYLSLPTLGLVPTIGVENGKNGKGGFLRRGRKHPELQAAGASDGGK
ncbi:MAG TPA: Wzz/FepE/Etk N-terminal domain-containing protein [Terriglobia bacterium]